MPSIKLLDLFYDDRLRTHSAKTWKVWYSYYKRRYFVLDLHTRPVMISYMERAEKIPQFGSKQKMIDFCKKEAKRFCKAGVLIKKARKERRCR